MSALTSQMAATGLPLVTIADMAVSNMRYTVDGDDSLGYKIILESPGAAAQDLYVVKDGGRYKVAAFGESGSNIEDRASSDREQQPVCRKKMAGSSTRQDPCKRWR